MCVNVTGVFTSTCLGITNQQMTPDKNGKNGKKGLRPSFAQGCSGAKPGKREDETHPSKHFSVNGSLTGSTVNLFFPGLQILHVHRATNPHDMSRLIEKLVTGIQQLVFSFQVIFRFNSVELVFGNTS